MHYTKEIKILRGILLPFSFFKSKMDENILAQIFAICYNIFWSFCNRCRS